MRPVGKGSTVKSTEQGKHDKHYTTLLSTHCNEILPFLQPQNEGIIIPWQKETEYPLAKVIRKAWTYAIEARISPFCDHSTALSHILKLILKLHALLILVSLPSILICKQIVLRRAVRGPITSFSIFCCYPERKKDCLHCLGGIQGSEPSLQAPKSTIVRRR